MFSYDGASKNKNEIVYCFYCNGHLKHIHMPPHQHPATVYTVGYNVLPPPQAEDQYSPRDGSPPNNTDGTNRQKSNNFSRRRISSPIYTAARHYRHRLTCKDLPERCIVGYDTTRPQIEAYEGRRWPSFSGSRLRLVVFLCFCGWLSACVPYLAESHDHLHFAKLLCKKLDGRWG